MYDPTYDDIDEMPMRDARKWAMFCHLGGLALLTGIPFANIIVPLIIWLAKRDEDPFIDYHGREAVNFQITESIYFCVLAVVSFILVFVLIGLLLLPLLFIFPIIQCAFSIIAAMKANDGRTYRYPLTIRFIS